MTNSSTIASRWDGEYMFALRSLLLKDFRVRYRAMSLGVGWSLANPLVMMAVLTFVFTQVFKSPEPNYPIFVLCGLIPFNFFTLAWATGTTSLVDNAGLIKRTRFPREIVPVTTVFGNVLHFLIQMGLLLSMVLLWGKGINIYWLYLPVLVGLEIVFVVGLALLFSALDVYIRDTQYVVQSFNLVFFYLVPIFYSFDAIPRVYYPLYWYNPVAAVVMAFRNVLLDGRAPASSLMMSMALVSVLALAVGILVFQRLKKHFYDYL